MTGQSRFVQKSQITLFVALLMALCFLMFNYWNLSKQNVDLSYEYKKLFDKFAKTSIDIKKVTDDHAVVRKQYIEMLEELKKINVESDILKVKVKEKSENVLKMQKNLNGKESQLSLIQSDMVKIQHDLDDCHKHMAAGDGQPQNQPQAQLQDQPQNQQQNKP